MEIKKSTEKAETTNWRQFAEIHIPMHIHKYILYTYMCSRVSVLAPTIEREIEHEWHTSLQQQTNRSAKAENQPKIVHSRISYVCTSHVHMNSKQILILTYMKVHMHKVWKTYFSSLCACHRRSLVIFNCHWAAPYLIFTFNVLGHGKEMATYSNTHWSIYKRDQQRFNFRRTA